MRESFGLLRCGWHYQFLISHKHLLLGSQQGERVCSSPGPVIPLVSWGWRGGQEWSTRNQGSSVWTFYKSVLSVWVRQKLCGISLSPAVLLFTLYCDCLFRACALHKNMCFTRLRTTFISFIVIWITSVCLNIRHMANVFSINIWRRYEWGMSSQEQRSSNCCRRQADRLP